MGIKVIAEEANPKSKRKEQPEEATGEIVLQDAAKKRLVAFIERVERLLEEKAAIASDIKEVFAEAKCTGFDTPTMKKIIKLRSMEEHERIEAEALLVTYMQAVGLKQYEMTLQ